MARGQATVEDMTTSLMGVGSLSSLTDRPKRDSPLAVAQPQKSTGPEATSPAAVDRAAGESKATPSVSVSRKPVADELPAPEVAMANSDAQFTDVVMVPMTARMRTQVRDLAAELQRRRQDKSHRITANVVLRVAIESFLAKFDASDLGGLSSEAELLNRVSRLTRPSRKGVG